MTNFLTGLLTGFGLLVIKKAILEPLATNIGRNLLDSHVGPCCKRLDAILSIAGVDFDPEEVVRDYLDLDPEELSAEDIDRIVRQVFKVYDVRKIKYQ